jgi:hypothetical protein
VVKLVDRETVMDKVVYTATNPVAGHLVDDGPRSRDASAGSDQSFAAGGLTRTGLVFAGRPDWAGTE